MNETSRQRTNPGHWLLWLTAWSAQGAAILLASSFALEPTARWIVGGSFAALPLATLYFFLKKA